VLRHSPRYAAALAAAVALCSAQPLAPVVLGRFAHYMPLLPFPSHFKVDVPAAVAASREHRQRMARNKVETKYDYLGVHLEQILTEPHLVPSFCAISQTPDALDAELQRVLLFDLAEFYADHVCRQFAANFESYRSADSQTAKFYYPIIQFYDTVIALVDVPPVVAFDSSARARICPGELIRNVFERIARNIVFASFALLGRLFENSTLCFFDDQRIFTKWYLVLAMFCCARDKRFRASGFRCAVVASVIGYVGSSLLIPLLIALVERRLLQCDRRMTSFLSLSPLFAEAFPVPAVVSAFLRQRATIELIDDLDALFEDSPKTFAERVDAVVLEICESHFSDAIDAMLPVLAQRVAFEAVRAAPSAAAVFHVLGCACHAIEF
jgi:hypothetical protein